MSEPERIMVGDALTMIDLRVGKQYAVTVQSVDADGRVTVSRDSDGQLYRIGTAFLRERKP